MRLGNWEFELRRTPVENGHQGPAGISATDLLERYDLVEVTDDSILVTEAPKKLQEAPPLNELGTTGSSVWTRYMREEYNPELRGWLGLQKYDRMRRSDGQIRGTLRLIKTPVLAARWYIEAASDSRRDQRIAEHVWNCLTKWMSVSWPQLLTEMLLMLDFGYYMFEKVYTFRDNKVIWQKLAPRHPLDVIEWDYDRHGGPNRVRMYAPDNSAEGVWIPIDKLTVFTFDKEGGDMEGISILRSAYKHWYFKENLYKIDAIQKERHGIGVPVIKLPPNFSPADRALADEMGRNLRTNEKAHITLPPNWDIVMLKLEGQPVDAMVSIEHHDLMIARNVLGQFINASTGNTQEEQQQLFLKATRFIADIIRDAFNKWAIPQLVDYNWANVDEYPELKVRRIGDTVDWRTISFAIRNFIGAGVIIPDDQLEKWVRDEMDLPAANVDTARIIVPPQQAGTLPQGPPDANPGPGGAAAGLAHQNQGVGGVPTAPQAGLPRQSTAGGMRRAQQPPATGRTADRSGG